MLHHEKQARFDAKFFLYFLGTGTWLAFTSFSVSSYPLAVFAENNLLVHIVQIGCFSLSFFVIGFVDYFKGPFRQYTLVVAIVIAFSLSLFIIAAYELLGLNRIFQYASAACLAFGSACGYCQWLRILTLQSYRKAQWLLALGSIIPTAMMFVFNVIPSTITRGLITFVMLAPLSILLLAINVYVNEIEGENRETPKSNESLKELGKDVLLPIVCAMALVLITPIASTSFGNSENNIISNDVILPLAHACSLLLLMIIWFVFKKDTTLPQLYCVFLPIFASLIFLLPLFAPEQTWIVLFIGDGSFFFVSILMVTTCLFVSHKHHFSSISIYGLFAGCVYFSNVVQLALELFSQNGSINFEPYAAALLLLYVLVIPAFFIVAANRNRKAKSTGVMETSDTMLSDTESACCRITSKRGLSNRQAEMLSLLALGRDVTYIANALYLSPNTVRSYRKALYATLDIHSKQELIDLVEAERKEASAAAMPEVTVKFGQA